MIEPACTFQGHEPNELSRLAAADIAKDLTRKRRRGLWRKILTIERRWNHCPDRRGDPLWTRATSQDSLGQKTRTKESAVHSGAAAHAVTGYAAFWSDQ